MCRERYKRELNFSRFGYTSIISLVCVLEDVVHIQRSDDGKWLLRDARAAAAAEAARPRRYLPVSVARLAHAHHDRVDPDDALPGIDFVSFACSFLIFYFYEFCLGDIANVYLKHKKELEPA